jgi:hypothetical protein
MFLLQTPDANIHDVYISTLCYNLNTHIHTQPEIADSKELAASLDAAERPNDPYFNKLLRIATTRCMAPAQYFSSGELSSLYLYVYMD